MGFQHVLDITFFEWSPPLQTFGHIFWHFLWQSIWHLVWHSFWHLIWHSIWHFICHSIWLSMWHSSCAILSHIFIWRSIWHVISGIIFGASRSGPTSLSFASHRLAHARRHPRASVRKHELFWERPWLTLYSRSKKCKVKTLQWHQSQGIPPGKRIVTRVKEPTVQQQPGPGRSRTCFLHKPACCMSQWQQAKTVATESQFRGNYRYFWITLEQTEKTNQKTTKTTRKKQARWKTNTKPRTGNSFLLLLCILLLGGGSP